MKQIRTIAFNTYRLLFRTGGGRGVLVLALCLSVFVFWQARGDDVLEHELRLRLRYGTGFGVVFLSLSVLFLGCLSIRADLDSKVLQMLTSYPLSRWRLWVGKWLGLVLFSSTALACIFAGVGVSAAVFGLRRGEGSRLGGELPPGFWRCYRAVQPLGPSLDELVEREYERRVEDGRIAADAPRRQVERDLREEVRREEQLLEPGGVRSWEFDLGERPVEGDAIILEYTFFAQNRRQLITGDWRVEAVDAPGRTLVPVQVYPYTTGRVRFPAAIVPASGRVRITFAGYQTPYLIFPRGKAVQVLVDDGTIWWNAARMGCFLVLHLGVVAAAGLTLATVLTFPVAAFVGVVLYVLAIGTRFFEGVARELGEGGASVFRSLSEGAIRFGLLITGGLSMPPVLERFSDGLSIRFAELAGGWGVGYALFMGGMTCAGVIWLTRKELDRIH